MSRRAFAAVVFSALVHLAILVPAVWLGRSVPQAARERASVAVEVFSSAPAAPASAVAPGVTEAARAPVHARAPSAVREVKAPSSEPAAAAHSPVAEAVAVDVVNEPAEAPGGSGAGEASASAPSGGAENAGRAGEGAAPAVAVAPPGVDPGLEAALHQRLQAGASRCYPSASRRFHERGTSEVSFCVGAAGQLEPGRLARSSGSERLDRAALDCVVAGAEPFPQAQGRCFALPVRFGE